MIIQNNDENRCLLDFKCTKSKLIDCTFFNNKKSKIICSDEYNGYCFNLLAQREVLLEILYPDEADSNKLIAAKKQILDEDKKKKKELSTIGLGKSKNE